MEEKTINELPKLEIYTVEALKEQYETGKITLDFMFEYISTRDKVYNKLIDRVNADSEKIKLLNEMNETNYNNYCEEIKETKRLEKILEFYKGTLSRNHKLTHILYDLVDALDDELIKYQTGFHAQDMNTTIKVGEHIKVLQNTLKKVEELEEYYGLNIADEVEGEQL